MELQGSRALAVTQQQAWDALLDPQVLKACIPGCEKLEATAPNQYAAAVALRIGPVAAKFNGKFGLSDVNAPASCTIAFDGQAGAAGFGKGAAQVRIEPKGSSCELAYDVKAQVGGKIAQVGQRLIDSVAKAMAEDFFTRFDEEMRKRHPSEAWAPAPEKQGAAVPVWAWGAGVIVLAAIAWWGLR